MAINLQKGQRIDLTKTNAGLSKIMVGLGWDQVSQSSGGFLGGLFGSKQQDIDCDASVLLLDENGRIGNKKNLVYFGNLRTADGSVVHTGDNLTGAGEGDDEQIIIDLNGVKQSIKKMVFVVNIYDCRRRNQDFGMIQNAFIRVVDGSNNKELIRYNLTDNYAGKTSLFVGELYRKDNEWKFAATGEGTNHTGLKEIMDKYM